MIYGYLRCSTNEERQDIKRQEREIKTLIDSKVDKFYYEYESGTKIDRKQLSELLSVVNTGDTIVCTEVSRISRSTKQLCDIIELAKDKKLKLVFGGFIVDCTKDLDPMTEGMLKMMGVFSEMERNMISSRVKSGMANAKAKGKIIGRPNTSLDDIPNNFLKHYPKLKNKELTKVEFSKLTGLSRPTIDKYIKIVEGN